MNNEYVQDNLFCFFQRRINDCLVKHKKEEAQKEAFLWLQEYVDPLGITVAWNWKIAKKQIAAFYFGKTKSVQIDSKTDIQIGVEFFENNRDQKVRCSYHKFDSACHSESRRIDQNTIGWLVDLSKSMGEKDIIEVFTESSSETTTCFRRVSSQYNEYVSYEIGFGQAMYVFETNRGEFDVASADGINGSFMFNETKNKILLGYLKELIFYHEAMLAIKTHMICYYLGIPQVSIEGYFDTARMSSEPAIVDIDLPFDIAFF